MPKCALTAPFLKSLSLRPERVRWDVFPFDRLEFLQANDFSVAFEAPVTLFVGENGSGKSTLLEAIAQHCGFHAGGGSEQHRLHRTADDSRSALARTAALLAAQGQSRLLLPRGHPLPAAPASSASMARTAARGTLIAPSRPSPMRRPSTTG